MNDLELLRELGAETRMLTLPELSSARGVVVAGMGRRRGPARRALVVAVAVGAAAAVVAGVMVGGTHTSARVPGHAVSPQGAAVQLTAKQVLDRAARAALREAVVVPRGDQFVFTKVGGRPGGPVSDTWLSVDGTRDGLAAQAGPGGKVSSGTTLLGCANGVRHVRLPGYNGKRYHGPAKPKKPVPMDGPVVTVPCTPVPAFYPDMPTTAGAMGAYLEKTQGIRLGDVNDLAKTVGYMLEAYYILPAQRAALYEYLATTPGLVIEHDVRDISGRPGVGVGWSFEGSKAMNIFDPETYAYLGMMTWGIHGEQGGDALLQTAIVDRAGQLPPGS